MIAVFLRYLALVRSAFFLKKTRGTSNLSSMIGSFSDRVRIFALERKRKFFFPKFVLFLTVIAAFFITVIPGNTAYSQDNPLKAGLPEKETAKKKILVLGTSTDIFSDVEDRIFRESLMRKYLNAGFDIVPVMEMESLINEESVNPQKVSKKEYGEICKSTGADFAVSGSVKKKGGEMSYVLSVYDFSKDSFSEKVFLFDVKRGFNDYCEMLSETVFSESIKILKSGK